MVSISLDEIVADELVLLVERNGLGNVTECRPVEDTCLHNIQVVHELVCLLQRSTLDWIQAFSNVESQRFVFELLVVLTDDCLGKPIKADWFVISSDLVQQILGFCCHEIISMTILRNKLGVHVWHVWSHMNRLSLNGNEPRCLL